MNGTMIFVLSDMRSGSTLLDQLLGAHPAIMSVGELHWLPAYVHQDRANYDPAHDLVCTCGATVPQCEFWAPVATQLARPLDSLRLRATFVEWSRGKGFRSQLAGVPRRLLESHPNLFRRHAVQRILGGKRLLRDSFDLFDALIAVSGRRFVVDSSKSTYRFRAIRDACPERSFALLLARDYRAVVHSKMKRGHSLEAAAIGWRNKMIQIEALTEDLPLQRQCRVRYEDLCTDPARELTRICDSLGLEFTPSMLARPTENVHHIGGSPSKFDRSRVGISMDTAYKDAFEPAALFKIRQLVGDVARRWGY